MAGPAWFAAAVPVRTKIPVPMIAPMPRSVRSNALSVLLSAFAPCSTSPTRVAIDLVFSRFESIHPPRKAGTPVDARSTWEDAAIETVRRRPTVRDAGQQKRGDYTLNGR